jgi:ribonuclease R
VRYAEKYVGEEFLGTITSMNAKGLFIEIDDLSIDGFLEIDRLGYDYQFSERQMMYQTRKSGRRILLGDKLKVLIARANPHTQRIDLEPADKNIEHRNRSQRAPEDNKRRLEPVMRLESVTKSTETREEARAGGRRGPQAFLERVEKIKSIKKDPSAGPSHPPKPRDKSERKADRGRSRRGGR